jgi:hypothetical protein
MSTVRPSAQRESDAEVKPTERLQATPNIAASNATRITESPRAPRHWRTTGRKRSGQSKATFTPRAWQKPKGCAKQIPIARCSVERYIEQQSWEADLLAVIAKV